MITKKDAIEAAVEAVDDYLDDYDLLRDTKIREAINALPDNVTETGWHLTRNDGKDGLPPEPDAGADVYYSAVVDDDVKAVEYNVMIYGATRPTSLLWDGEYFFDEDGYFTYRVSAWKPIPDPPQEVLDEAKSETRAQARRGLWLMGRADL